VGTTLLVGWGDGGLAVVGELVKVEQGVVVGIGPALGLAAGKEGKLSPVVGIGAMEVVATPLVAYA
jgi:hypothetical protein